LCYRGGTLPEKEAGRLVLQHKADPSTFQERLKIMVTHSSASMRVGLGAY